ncbi:ABC-type branched-chain amino acid transport system, substrate-binding protein [Mariniphaga anaerophila]|uniref:ABC-type branched-chain amino acid transport system, substrate-binding protein n=1 Tax=Mariniphaga anaerophila TaxID=1484053 RepID=A0A1M5EV63_9BACT|nr:LysM peptidoglycan-binding domain-containing protein [Mariniphaga anaerophila]SHF83108.1 ABC-type branched-chain amino acid transport system, substrate-binding protein [Mariniphaga anaerophila]
MKISRYFLFALLFAGIFCEAVAQPLKENEIVVIQGEKFVLHQVRTGETVFSISQQYKTDTQILAKYNPQILEGLKIGDILKVPYREDVELPNFPDTKKGDPSRFEYYTISSRRETPYFIAKEFGVTIEEIYAYNPEITRFRKGTKLRIPVWESAEAVSTPETKPMVQEKQKQPEQKQEMIMHEVRSGETLYSLSKKYKISESEILFLNPGARNLKAGSVVYLPKKQEPVFKSPADKISNTIDETNTKILAPAGNYFDHLIVSGETLWALTQKYGVTEEELKQLNPVLESGFPTGTTIKIPVKASELSSAEPVNEDAFIRHVVQPRETLFRLSSQYHLTIPEIRKFNPQLENRNLVQGETILIPRRPEGEIVQTAEITPVDSLKPETPLFESDFYDIDVPVVIPENCRPGQNPMVSVTTYDVALFLPLYIYANDTLNKKTEPYEIPFDSLWAVDDSLSADTLIEQDKPVETFHGFYRESENFLQFYEGVLLAIDSLKKAGMNIRLNVFDTQQSPDSIRKYIYADGFLETDLIIGPVYPKVQNEVADIAAKNRIPIISPLSSQSRDISSNPYYYQVNPTREYLAAKTAELVTEEYFNSNFVVVKTSNSGGLHEEKVVDMVRERMQNSGLWEQPQGMQFHVYDFANQGRSGLKGVFSPDKENVVFVSSMNEGDLSLVLSNINNLVGEYSITLIGFNRYEQFESISDEFFHNLKLQYIAPYWVDYSHPATIRFLEKFKKHYYTEPNNFGMQGYDVAFYFLSALKNYGKGFEDCLPYQQVHLSQGNYSFEKVSPFGGYMNHGVSVISYGRNFDVVRKRVVGPFRIAQK